ITFASRDHDAPFSYTDRDARVRGDGGSVPVANAVQGAAMLAAGKVDGYAGGRIVLADLKLRSPSGRDFSLLGVDFSYEPYGIALRRDDPDFRLAVNRALVDLVSL